MTDKTKVCFRLDNDLDKLLEAIKEEYGIDKSVVIRLAVSWFAPAFYLALQRLELELKAELDRELEEKLREAVARRRVHLST